MRRLRTVPAAAWLASIALFLLAAVAPLSGQTSRAREYQIKAGFIFNFVQFVEWPTSAFPTADAPIRIGLLGDDPFNGGLDATVQGEKIKGRSIVVERGNRLAELAGCHVIFVGSSQRTQTATIVAALAGQPVFTVGDMPKFAEQGGILNFYLEGQKLRFEINRAAAQRSGLRLRSQLLALARLVGPAPETGGR